MSCKYLESLIEIQPEYEEGEYGEAILVGKKEILVGEYCHKIQDYVDSEICNKCKEVEE